MNPTDSLTRRDIIKGAAGAGLIAAMGPLAGCIAPAAQRRDAIATENRLPGTTDWMLVNTRVDPATKCRCPWVEGYCSRTSVSAGETIDIKVSTNPPAAVMIDFYRLGYYGGKGGRHLRRLGPFQCAVQPDPEIGPERVRECRWKTTAQIEIPADWLSGVYLGKLTESREGLQSYVVFIVRDDRTADFLFQCSDTTWLAYNRWPGYFSLYDDGTPPHNWYTGPGVRAGWDRPYGKYRQILDAPLSQGSGEFLLWEYPLAFWMEQQGYDVSYISNVDTHTNPRGLLRTKGFLSVGHDEYWSVEMYDNVKAAIAAGVNAAFFGGNSVDGVAKFWPNPQGSPNRSISRVGHFGRVDFPDKFPGRWAQDGPDAALLMGAKTTFPATGRADWTCVNERHWLFEGTGMKNGDAIIGLVGWEHHGIPAALPGLEIVARGPITNRAGRPTGADYTATIYPGPKNNVVFNAATIWWSDGLSAPPGYKPTSDGKRTPNIDPRVQRITSNLLKRFLGA